jgi:LmbE family N-acetylglucosaminyl deacetylase
MVVLITFLAALTTCQRVRTGFPEIKTQKVQTQPIQKIFPQIIKLNHEVDLLVSNSASSPIWESQNLKDSAVDIIPQIEEFNSNDKVLILAPHPDDESIGTAGVIQQALKAGAKINVVCLTNGDFQTFTFTYSNKAPIKFIQFLQLGITRSKESMNAVSILGLKESDIKFLGYPDSGTLSILTDYWGNVKPYVNTITKAFKVPYPECYSTGAEYVGENILKDLEDIIKEFQPTKIFLSSPFDLNKDHRALYVFLKVALWDLEGIINSPGVFTYLVHSKNWPEPKGYYPEKFLNPPEQIAKNNILWSSLYLNDDEIKKKYKSLLCYKSQMRFGLKYLTCFDRKNELFADFYDINLENKNQSQIVWEVAATNDLFYALNNGILSIKIIPKQKVDKDFNMSIYLLGYSHETEFSKMPKINLKINSKGLKIFDKNKEINTSEIKLKYNEKSIIISIPIIFLENPKYILSGIETNNRYLSFSTYGWRVLKIYNFHVLKFL